jgi:hypothetical protein
LRESFFCGASVVAAAADDENFVVDSLQCLERRSVIADLCLLENSVEEALILIP